MKRAGLRDAQLLHVHSPAEPGEGGEWWQGLRPGGHVQGLEVLEGVCSGGDVCRGHMACGLLGQCTQAPRRKDGRQF